MPQADPQSARHPEWQRRQPATARRRAPLSEQRSCASTRTGLDWTDRFVDIAKAAAKLPDGIIDGEVAALNAEPEPAAPAEPKPVKRLARGKSAPVLTSPERVLWPATANTPAVTKADLLAYYMRYADRILEQAAGRPLSLLRAPEGITGGLFFQRHAMTGQSPLIGAVAIEGQSRPYMRIDDVAGLAALAQVSAVELHPGGAPADAPADPDRLVFDLDPAEGLAWDRVVAGALELRDRLSALGLACFARVTGGKGLHVVVPLKPSKRGGVIGWDDAKSFARLVCALMERDAPDLYTTNMAKRARKGRIFLDYLRNDRLSTAIASWSPRARPGAPVARPVPWSAVRRDLDPAGWSLPALTQGRLSADAWAGYADAAVPLRRTIKKLARLT